jgi:hypothetical protein
VENMMEKSQSINTHDDVGIFQCFETVYINPFSTKVYFLSEEAKKITLLGAERSMSTKMVSIYEKCGAFLVEYDSIPSFQFDGKLLTDIKDKSSEGFERALDIDQRKNRAKGFLYSYLLGDNKSLDKDLVEIKLKAREISNVISAIVHSSDKTMTSQQQESLKNLFEQFFDVYKKIDDDTKIFCEKMESICSQANITIDSARVLFTLCGFSWEDVENNVINKYKIDKPFNIKRLFDNFNYESLTKNNCTISEIVVEKEKIYLSKKIKTDISAKVTFANLKLTSLSEEKADFYTTLINEFVSIDYQKESKINIAVRGTTLLKKMHEDNILNWENSQDRTYYNELLANLQGKGGFDVLKMDNIIRQSFALFVLYKDDIEKIETALISNLISEYRFAFGLWGAFVGFAGMPKTLTNDLFLSDDLDYISEVYKYVYKQIHGIELEGILEKKKQEKYETIQPKMNKGEEEQLTQTEEAERLYSELEKAVPSVKPDKNKYIQYFKEYGSKPKELIEQISNDKTLYNGKGAPKKVMNFLNSKFGSSNENNIAPPKQLQKEKNQSIFANSPVPKELYLDDSVFDRIESILPEDKKICKKVKTEIDWIQKVHKENGYKKKTGEWVKLEDHSNQAVIKHFENNSKSRIDSNLMTQIISKLKELYL